MKKGLKFFTKRNQLIGLFAITLTFIAIFSLCTFLINHKYKADINPVTATAPWQFAVIGDTGANYVGPTCASNSTQYCADDFYRQNMTYLAQQIPNSSRVVLLHTGDMSGTGLDPEFVGGTYNSTFYDGFKDITSKGALLTDWALNPPKYLLAMGNHEYTTPEASWASYFPKQVGLTAYSTIPSEPHGRWGSYVYQNTLFMWLDNASNSSKTGQDAYVDAILSKASTDPAVKWKVVFFHKAALTCDQSKTDDATAKAWLNNYFIKYGIDVVFDGHSHLYQRTCPVTSAGTSVTCDPVNLGSSIGDSNGVVQITFGGGGDGFINPKTDMANVCPFVKQATDHKFGFQTVTVTDTTFNIKAWGWTYNNTTKLASALSQIDDFTITKASSSLPTVNVGADQTATVNQVISINATTANATSYAWSKTSGPGNITFGTGTAEDTTIKADTIGTYVIRLTAVNTSGSAYDELTLTVTQGGTSNAWRFVALGDTQGNDSIFQKNVSVIRSKVPDSERVLTLQTGDLTDNATATEWTNWKNNITPLISNWQNITPPKYFASVGNHDDGSFTGGTPTFLDAWKSNVPMQLNQTAYLDVAGDPNGLYGSTIVNNTLFIWLNSVYEERTFYGGKYGPETFLSSTLTKAETDSRVKWKVVVFHTPAYPNGVKTAVADLQKWYDNYLIPKGVDLVLNGHAHYYSRSCPFTALYSAQTCESGTQGQSVLNDPKGVIQVILPAGSAGFEAGMTTPSWVEKAVQQKHGFLEFNVNDTSLNVKAWNIDDAVVTNGTVTTQPPLLDQFTIMKDASTLPTVNVGADQTAIVNQAISVNATTTNGTSYQWSKTSGPGNITFGTATSEDTTIKADTIGTYVIRLTATNTSGSAYDELTLTVNNGGGSATANVGSDKSSYINVPVSINATTTNAATFAWTKVSGPGAVTFGTPNTEDTTVKADTAGVYTIRLTVNGTVSDDLILTINKNGDIDNNGSVGDADFSLLLYNWGTPTNPQADLDKDGLVGDKDFSILLYWWGR